MEMLDELEFKLDILFQRVERLERQNITLKNEMERAKRQKEEAVHHIDRLLRKVQEVPIG